MQSEVRFQLVGGQQVSVQSCILNIGYVHVNKLCAHYGLVHGYYILTREH